MNFIFNINFSGHWKGKWHKIFIAFFKNLAFISYSVEPFVMCLMKFSIEKYRGLILEPKAEESVSEIL